MRCVFTKTRTLNSTLIAISAITYRGSSIHVLMQDCTAGVDFILCVSNTWHRINFMKDVATPLLHIVDPTAKTVLAAGLNKILLLGTKSTMAVMWMREMYTERFGIETMVPSNEDQNYINGVIFNELTQNQFRDESRRQYLSIIKKACQEGAQGVILGCTEIGLLVKQLDCPELPLFDPLKLHADAAVEMALSDGPNPQKN